MIRADQIKYCLEKAFYLARCGRSGPCWLEIPIDIQGSFVELEKLEGFVPDIDSNSQYKIENSIILLCEKMQEAQRPVIYAGNGIRISACNDTFIDLVEELGIPVVTCWDSIDLIDSDNK